MDAIRGVVSLVIGQHPEPAWLDTRLRRMSGTVRAYLTNELSAPKRSEMRARLEAFRDAILQVREDLTDPLFVCYIGNDWSDLPLGLCPVLDTLEGLANKAGGLSNKFAGRAGSERAYPTERDDTVSAQELCAWTIMRAMRLSRGLPTVAADNHEAWAACNAYWKCSGGGSLGKAEQSNDEGRPPSGWRSHIIAIQHIEKEDSRRSAGLASMGLTFDAITLGQFNNE